jgi:hypothetical protein
VMETGAEFAVEAGLVGVDIDVEPQPARRKESMAATRGRKRIFRIASLLRVRS